MTARQQTMLYNVYLLRMFAVFSVVISMSGSVKYSADTHLPFSDPATKHTHTHRKKKVSFYSEWCMRRQNKTTKVSGACAVHRQWSCFMTAWILETIISFLFPLCSRFVQSVSFRHCDGFMHTCKKGAVCARAPCGAHASTFDSHHRQSI